MGNLTLEQILAGGGILVALCALAYKCWNGFKVAVKNAVDEQFKTLTDAIAGIDKRLDSVDMESCKNFLVRCLADLEKGEHMTETEKQRFYEQYDYYLKHDGNSYIREKVDKYKREGTL